MGAKQTRSNNHHLSTRIFLVALCVVCSYGFGSRTSSSSSSSSVVSYRSEDFGLKDFRDTRRSFFASYDTLNYTALLDIADRLWTPNSLLGSLSISIPILCFRTTALLTFGSFYQHFKSHSSGQPKTLVDSVGYYFNSPGFIVNVGRNFRNLVIDVLGRILVDLVFYGPINTYNGIFQTYNLTTFVRNPFLDANAFSFVLGMGLESVGEIMGFLVFAFIGNLGLYKNPPLPKTTKTKTKRELPRPSSSSSLLSAKEIDENFYGVLQGLQKSQPASSLHEDSSVNESLFW